MFDVVLQDRDLPAARRAEAVNALERVVVEQADRRLADVEGGLEQVRAQLARSRRSPQQLRRLESDLVYVSEIATRLATLRAAPSAHADKQLDGLLQMLGPLVAAVEIGSGNVATRMGFPRRPKIVRSVLEPREKRPERVRIQIYDPASPPRNLGDSGVPCLGPLGNLCVDEALDKVDLVTWALTMLSWARTNGAGQ